MLTCKFQPKPVINSFCFFKSQQVKPNTRVLWDSNWTMVLLINHIPINYNLSRTIQHISNVKTTYWSLVYISSGKNYHSNITLWHLHAHKIPPSTVFQIQSVFRFDKKQKVIKPFRLCIKKSINHSHKRDAWIHHFWNPNLAVKTTAWFIGCSRIH